MGTLHPDRAPPEIRSVVREMKRMGPATVTGKLYDLGDYPALSFSGRERISGTLFQLPRDPRDLQMLDAYEEYLPDDPGNSLFLRRKRTVTLPNGRKERHWVYVYNGELPAAA